jgi:hypothetical protein
MSVQSIKPYVPSFIVVIVVVRSYVPIGRANQLQRASGLWIGISGPDYTQVAYIGNDAVQKGYRPPSEA